ncbi:MAG: trigger factor, partial [Cyanobacteria bacterium P01_H01_bin.153]
MKVTQEQLPDSQVGLQIEIPPEVSKQTYEKVLKKLIKTVRIPGFRPGKVPRPVFLQRFGTVQIKAAALEELVQNAVEQAIKDEEIEAIGNYQLTSEFEELIEQYTPGEALTFQASVDVPPRVTLEKYTGLEVKAEEIKYEASKVDQVLEQYRLNLATLVPIEERAAQMGDVAVVDFEGQVEQEDGSFEPFDGGSAEDFQVELKEGGFIDGFVEGIVGMSPDETKELSLKFPEDYPQETLAGKAAKFTVTAKELKEKELPELDDDFAEEVSEFGTLEELRASLEKRYQEEAQDETESNQFEALLEELLKHLDAEIPETLIRREANYLVQQAAVRL